MKLCIKQCVILTLRQYSVVQTQPLCCCGIIKEELNKVTLKMTRTHFFIRQIALSHFSLMAPRNWLFSC